MSATALLTTPLHALHLELGARMVPFAGWEMPVQYSGLVDEHHAVRKAAGLFDVSHMGEYLVTGEHAAAVVNYLVTNDVGRLEDGGAMYTLLCNEKGTVVDDLIVYRHAPDRFLIVCNASNREKVGRHLARFCEHHCDLKDVSDETGLIALQGPKAAEILAATGPAAAEAVKQTKSFRFRKFEVAGVPVTAARTGYTGEDGFELFCPWGETAKVWRELMRAGEPHGLKPVGLGARDTLRLEARLSLYGNEIDETTDPLEAGLGWAVKLNSGLPFLGREALAARQTQPLQKLFTGFTVADPSAVLVGRETILRDGQPVGYLTSGGYGYSIGQSIGYGYVRNAAGVTQDWLTQGRYSLVVAGEELPATLALRPLVDPEGARIRA